MLTDAQKVDVRRWAGYPTPATNAIDTLSTTLDALAAVEEVVLTDNFLPALATLEAAILSAADNLDSESAGPWKANPREIAQRRSLYNAHRREMCSFLGLVPGPGLGDGSVMLVRR